MFYHFLLTTLFISFVYWVNCEKYKICIVDGKGGFKRSLHYCPTLDQPDSKVECVLGIDRLDCLRRLSKKKADFSVFTPEDLVTATNSEIEILITNELRYTEDPFEYEVVALVRDSSGIRSKHDLKDKRFCHPGYGYETDWTRILSNYLEASVVPQSCDSQFTLTENRIRASSRFFKSACKAGPWVHNPQLDQELKQKYPNLCAICDNPQQCETSDKYWGRRGPLYCLTDGAGDVSWARLDDVRIHFGFVPGSKETDPEGYSFLCPDGTLRALNNQTHPCIWVVKPWPVIATQRALAQQIQEITSSLERTNDRTHWKSALLNLMETFRVNLVNVQPLDAIESYLAKAEGFLNANSFSGCHPPRTVRVCAKNTLEFAKCSWMRESAAVYGVEPDLECILGSNLTSCATALSVGAADLLLAPADFLATAVNTYHLETLFYETAAEQDQYITVAVVKSDSALKSFAELQGKTACFPAVNGVALNTVKSVLRAESHCLHSFLYNYTEAGTDEAALKCLRENRADVAFVSKNSVNLRENAYKVLCKDETQCYVSWAPLGQAMVRNSSNLLWKRDALDVFLQLDILFGRNFKSLTAPFLLFGLFDGNSDVLFHDNTVRLRSVPSVKDFNVKPRFYGDLLKSNVQEDCSHSFRIVASVLLVVVSGVLACFL